MSAITLVMAIIAGAFRGLDSATLAQMRIDWRNCLQAISFAQSYSIAGRSYTKANLAEVIDIIREINIADSFASGATSSTTYADLSA